MSDLVTYVDNNNSSPHKQRGSSDENVDYGAADIVSDTVWRFP